MKDDLKGDPKAVAIAERYAKRIIRFRCMFEQVLAVAVREGLTNDAAGKPRARGCLGFFLGRERPPLGTLYLNIGGLPFDAPEWKLCIEKIFRVVVHDLISSYQRRDRDRQMYGGCVRLRNDLIVGFSGSGEEAEQALILVTALLCGEIVLKRLADVLAIGGSGKFYRLLETCKREDIAA